MALGVYDNVDRAIELHDQINGYSDYYSNRVNWNNIKKIYFIGRDGFMAIKEYTNNYSNIWLICCKKTNILFHLMAELAKDSYGNKTYIMTGVTGDDNNANTSGPLSNSSIYRWFQSMSFNFTNNGNTIMLQLEGKSLRNKFLFNTG